MFNYNTKVTGVTPTYTLMGNLTTKVRPNVGETWYYKAPRGQALTKGWVSDVTQNTVEFRNSEWATSSVRYALEDLVLVECVEAEKTNPPYPGAVSLRDVITKIQMSENQQ